MTVLGPWAPETLGVTPLRYPACQRSSLRSTHLSIAGFASLLFVLMVAARLAFRSRNA